MRRITTSTPQRLFGLFPVAVSDSKSNQSFITFTGHSLNFFPIQTQEQISIQFPQPNMSSSFGFSSDETAPFFRFLGAAWVNCLEFGVGFIACRRPINSVLRGSEYVKFLLRGSEFVLCGSEFVKFFRSSWVWVCEICSWWFSSCGGYGSGLWWLVAGAGLLPLMLAVPPFFLLRICTLSLSLFSFLVQDIWLL